jgi:hypothetical protein
MVKMKTKQLQLTEKRFREFCDNVGHSYTHSFCRKIDNEFNLSYHYRLYGSPLTFNFWFDKKSYVNSRESLTVSRNDSSADKWNRLKNIYTKITDFEKFKKIFKQILNEV